MCKGFNELVIEVTENKYIKSAGCMHDKFLKRLVSGSPKSLK
jgi:hypothetical protein